MKVRQSQHAALWLALALNGYGSRCWAQAPANLHVALDYRVDPSLRGCPTAPDFSATVARQLGYDPFGSETAKDRLRIEVARAPDGADAKIEWIDQQRNSEGERRLHGEGNDCSQLATSLAFAVAVQIQLHASASRPPGEPAPQSATPPAKTEPKPPSRPAAPVCPPTPPDDSAKQRGVYLGAGALVRYGLSPSVSPGARLFGTLAKYRWSLELSADFTAPSSFRLADGTGFTARELGVAAAPCVRFLPFGICAVGALGILHVRGEGVDRVGSPSSSIAGVGGRLQLAWPALEKLALFVHGDLLAVITPRDVVLNRAVVWSTAPVTATVSLDFAAIFR